MTAPGQTPDPSTDDRDPLDDVGFSDDTSFSDDTVTRRVDALFGDGTAAEVAGRRRRRRTRRVVVAGVVVTALLASAVWASLASGDAAGNYRTAEAGVHDVAQQLTGVATIEPVSQAAVAFPVSGTVATVDVAIGDTVAVGQQLATLDTASLTDELHEKEAALAQAELDLSKALAGESVTGSVAGSGGSPSSMGSSVSGASLARAVLAAVDTQGPAPSGPESSDQLSEARRAVADAQAAVDAALSASQVAMDNATAVCAAVAGGGSTTSGTTPSSTDLSACRTAIEAVQSAQQQVSDAQRALAAASGTLDQLLATMADSAASSSSGGSAPTDGAPPSNSTNGSPTGGSSTDGSPTGSSAGGNDTVSSEDLIAAQKAVDAAALQVAVAQQAVDQATIVSPIAGTVVSVGLTVGESVDARSDTQHVIVQGTGGYEVVTTIGVDDVPTVRVGQPAIVVPDGSTGDGSSLAGTVVAISPTPDPNASTTSFRVTVGLSEPDVELGNGSTGTVTITTDGATSVLAVPTSAVSSDGDRWTVTVFDGSGTDEVSVEVGAVGEQWTQITSGLEKGDRVVLADMDAALPSAATDTDSGDSSSGGPGGPRLPAGGQLPGGGQFPGGMTRPGG